MYLIICELYIIYCNYFYIEQYNTVKIVFLNIGKLYIFSIY